MHGGQSPMDRRFRAGLGCTPQLLQNAGPMRSESQVTAYKLVRIKAAQLALKAFRPS